MPTSTLASIAVTPTWANVVATHASAANVNLLIQNRGNDDVEVVFGGASPAVGTDGIDLAPFDSVQGNAAAIWVRAGVASRISVTLL